MQFTDTGLTKDTLPGTLRTRPEQPAPSLRRGLRKQLLRIIVAAASCAFLVILSVKLVDRPVATWIHEHLTDARFPFFTASYEGHRLPIGPFSFMAAPAEALGRPIALIVLTILAVLAAGGWRPGTRGRVVLALTVSILVALAINAQMKTIFGRTWPESWLGDNPSWIRNGVFGFFPFHGGKGWGSFPSGHTTVITAPAAILWIVWPKLRILWAVAVIVVIAGLLGGNYHFVSDTIGGLYLGMAVGLGIAGLILAPHDRISWSIIRHRTRYGQLDLPAPDERPAVPDGM